MSQTLYRARNQQGRLLYVGVAKDWGARWSGHRADKPWFPEVARIDLESYPDRASVLAAEKVAIQSERPLYNKVYNGPADRILTSRYEDVQDLLRMESRDRVRVFDDLTYPLLSGRRTDGRPRPHGTCRLQLFAAPGYRWVALATNVGAEGSLMNADNAGMAEHIWRHHCPWSYEPPIWIQNMLDLYPAVVALESNEWGFQTHGPTCLKCEADEPCDEFEKFDAYSLKEVGGGAGVDWLPITVDDIKQLVGTDVDMTRGQFAAI